MFCKSMAFLDGQNPEAASLAETNLWGKMNKTFVVIELICSQLHISIVV